MSAPTMPTRRPVATVRPPRPQLPQVPYQGLFLEPKGVPPYVDPDDDEDDD
ncbi:hypothetical protein [Streptomyces sp. NPDC055105]|uniref:hypothetical protein n=1 Tax=Streptomyces sp. NPDC055105 TaxID=3365719 RepID=UPI0037D59064